MMTIMLLFMMFVLFLSSYYIYTKSRKEIHYDKKTTDYSYLEINEMSDSFAIVDNKELHFVKDKNNIYMIAIKKEEKEKYQRIINYTYGKTKNKTKLKIAGFPIKINKEIKTLSIKYINHFLSYENRVDINEKNYEEYLPLTYLDTTIQEFYGFNYIVFFLFLLFILLFLSVLLFCIKKRRS